jgi:hypothetical protein
MGSGPWALVLVEAWSVEVTLCFNVRHFPLIFIDTLCGRVRFWGSKLCASCSQRCFFFLSLWRHRQWPVRRAVPARLRPSLVLPATTGSAALLAKTSLWDWAARTSLRRQGSGQNLRRQRSRHTSGREGERFHLSSIQGGTTPEGPPRALNAAPSTKLPHKMVCQLGLN